MKSKRQGQVERRRPLVEINLVAESRTRPSWPPKARLSSPKTRPSGLRRLGCAWFGSALILAAAAAGYLGLH